MQFDGHIGELERCPRDIMILEAELLVPFPYKRESQKKKKK